MEPKRYFVTGTDTNVGKTFVTAALARRVHGEGHRAFAFKPIETGTNGPLGDDQAELVKAAGGWQTDELAGLYRFRMPAAPSVAAAAEGASIDIDRIARVFEQGARDAALALIEGAGGLRVPVTNEVDMARLAAMLRLPLIIVARAGLGTINHSLLTLEAAEHSKVAIAALVLSQRPEDDLDFVLSNATEIKRRWSGRVIVFDGTPDQLAPLC